jgi:hypothetical protein
LSGTLAVARTDARRRLARAIERASDRRQTVCVGRQRTSEIRDAKRAGNRATCQVWRGRANQLSPSARCPVVLSRWSVATLLATGWVSVVTLRWLQIVDNSKRRELLADLALLDESKKRIMVGFQSYLDEEREIRERVEELKPRYVRHNFTFALKDVPLVD